MFLKSLIAIFAVAATAHAGEVLKLNTGTVRPAVLQAKYSALYAAGSQKTEWIVQFKSAVTEANKNSLRQIGAEVFGYLPEDALVVRSTAEILRNFQNSHAGAVNAFVPYAGSYKVSSDIGATSIFNRDQADGILLQTFKASEAASLAAQIQKLSSDVVVRSVDGRAITVSLPRHLIPMVAAMTGIEHLQPQPEFETLHFSLGEDNQVTVQGAGDYTDLKGNESGTQVMNFKAAYDQGFTGRGQIASMGDTGLDSGDVNTIHPDFKGAVKSGFYVGLFAKSWIDPMGHGTHVSGSIVGRGTASGGILRGGAYEAMYIPVGMWSPMLGGLSVPNKLSDLFGKAYGEGARIHSNSWGQPKNFGAYDSFASQVDDFMFNNPDMLVLFAAGNSGVDMDKDGRIDANSIGSPGTAKNVLTVGASENKTSTGGIQTPVSKFKQAGESWSKEPIFSSYISDNENGLAMFSSRGPTSDGRTKPEIVAPGTNILSVMDQTPGASPLWGLYNKDYAWAGGTSMATPLTAGAVTVTRQVLQERWKIANPSAALMKAVMIHTAVDMFPGQYGEVGRAAGQELLTRRPNSDEGYGRVDMSKVVGLNSASTVMVDQAQGVAQGAQVVYELNSAKSFNLLANLVWTDAPGSANAAAALVNDLDLTLITADGRSISMNDHINNNEIIEQSNLPAGAYKLVVKGAKVPAGKNGAQPFALVYSLK